MMRTLMATAAIVIAAGSAFAADKPLNQTVDLKEIPAGAYTLDKSHSALLASVNHLGFSEYYIRFTDFDAKLNLGEDKLEDSSVEVTIEMDEAEAHNDKMEDHFAEEKYFNPAVYPTATFKSTKLEMSDAETGKLTGDLTFRGITKPVVLDVTFRGGALGPFNNKYTIGFAAKGSFSRSEFGLTELVPMVSDRVQLTFDAEFNKVGEVVE